MSITRPVARPIVRPIMRSPFDAGAGDMTALVKAMFAGGEKGVMFDFTRASNLFTDSARTTPVTSLGDSIGSVTDLSPNAKHASGSGTIRPKWQGYAAFDGVDDLLQTASIDFSGASSVCVVVCIRKDTDADVGVGVELGSSVAASGAFGIRAPISAGDNFGFGSTGSATALASASGYAAPSLAVVTGIGSIASDTCIVRVNGVQKATSATDQGTGSYANTALNLGRRPNGSNPLSGRIYRAFVIGRTPNATELATVERWAAQPAGIIIP